MGNHRSSHPHAKRPSNVLDTTHRDKAAMNGPPAIAIVSIPRVVTLLHNCDFAADMGRFASFPRVVALLQYERTGSFLLPPVSFPRVVALLHYFGVSMGCLLLFHSPVS